MERYQKVPSWPVSFTAPARQVVVGLSVLELHRKPDEPLDELEEELDTQ